MSTRNRNSKRRSVSRTTRKKHAGVVVSNPPLQLARTGCFVPSRMRTSLRMTVTSTQAAANTYNQFVVSGNGCFDPGLSLSGTQPVGFDYWAAMYEKYRVIGSRCHVALAVEGTADGTAPLTSSPISVVLYPSNASGALSSLDDAASQPFATRVDVTPTKPMLINKTMKTSVITGVKDVLGADQLQALVSAQPANEWFWNLGTQADHAWTTLQLKFTFTVTYDVEFFDRAQINRSTMALIHKAYVHHCVQIEQRLHEQKSESKKAVSRFEIEKQLLMHELALNEKHGGEAFSEVKGVITGDIDSPVMVSVTEDRTVKKEPLSVKLPQSGAGPGPAGKASALSSGPISVRGLGGRILSLGGV